MIRFFTVVLMVFYIISANSQKEIVLRLSHALNDSSFKYNQIFEVDGNKNYYTRLQYYLSGFELEHDAGQSTLLNNVYVLASGHISNYYLGNFNISSLESISFDVGVDQIANSGNTTNYSAQHPLGPKSPPMDWGWPSGYFFVVTNGITDADNNNIPETNFELHALGDMMLSPIDPIYLSGTNLNDTIYIDLIVNTERFISGIDLRYVGADHSSSNDNLTMCNNSYNLNIFEPGYIDVTFLKENNVSSDYIFLDYTLSFAPTIHYHFESNNKVNLQITDINGKIHINEKNLVSQGSFFPLKELATGIYIVTIDNGTNRILKKFNVVQ
jgi:hypothetical protein